MYRYFPTGFCHLLVVSIELPPPKRMLLGSIIRNGAIILIEFFLKPFRSLTAICIQYVTIDLRNHVCLRVARISLHRLNVPAC
mgnify:CR=1 FL=1